MRNDSISKFVTALASKEPAPGGGAASALVGAVGTALMSMVANLTMGKEKFKQQEPLMKELLEKAENLQENLVSLMDRDTEAFNKVAAVFKMPKNTDDEKNHRKIAMQKALKYASEVPFSIMEKALEALYLQEKSLGHTNPSTTSDIGVGALCLKTALMGAWLNVKINLGSISDQSFVNEYELKAKKLLDEGMMIADKVYEVVVATL